MSYFELAEEAISFMNDLQWIQIEKALIQGIPDEAFEKILEMGRVRE